jgi:DNA-directed RNA polymerase specialized sigma24 family protein
MSSPSHSVSIWIEQLRAARDPQAAQALWDRFFARMVEVARRRLATAPRRAADEEDAALAAFLAFQRGLEQGRFPDLRDRNDLWNLLFTLTTRAAAGQVRHERRQRRGGGQVRGDSAWLSPEGEVGGPADTGPAPEEDVVFQDELGWLLESLDEPLRRIALARLEGCTVDEIAARIGCAAVTVRRRLHLIRLTWEHLTSGPDGKGGPG